MWRGHGIHQPHHLLGQGVGQPIHRGCYSPYSQPHQTLALLKSKLLIIYHLSSLGHVAPLIFRPWVPQVLGTYLENFDRKSDRVLGLILKKNRHFLIKKKKSNTNTNNIFLPFIGPFIGKFSANFCPFQQV